LAYFDIFDYPLTAWEAWKYLYAMKAEYADVVRALDELVAFEKIETRNGFYFLRGRNAIVDSRARKYAISEKKYKKTKRILKVLSLMPFVRCVCVINTLSYDNAREESDVDILLLVEAQRLWLSRFITVSFLRVFKFRPTEETRANTICLNIVAGLDGMNFENIALEPKDIHLAHILLHAVPVFDEKSHFSDFFQSNPWAKNIFPNAFGAEVSSRRKIQIRALGKIFKKIFEILLSVFPKKILERIFQNIQMKIMPQNLKKAANVNTNVVFSDTILKFHIKDRREEYNRAWREKIKSF